MINPNPKVRYEAFAVLSILLMFSLMPFEAFAQTAEHIHKPHPHKHKE